MNVYMDVPVNLPWYPEAYLT